MAKKESTLINMTLTLFMVTFLASASLGLVHNATKAPIAQAKLAKKNLAISNVLPPFDNQPLNMQKSYFIDGDSVRLYMAQNGDSLTGYAIETFTNLGFSGNIKLMAGFLPNGDIYKIEVLEHKETPGLGDKMEAAKSGFSAQFIGKNPRSFVVKVKKDGGNVDAITASTISSRAYCDAVNRAYKVFIQEGGSDKEP
ncbi:MAG: RnfABCDGE type electron transport complex subunit G [Bacteroidales bacterium]|nr:RnfABCDGE type electron transport complex subunit G [Bacteroidales bacterium]